MAIDTPEAELAAVNAAIEAILTGGQQIRRGGTSAELFVAHADLAELYRRKSVLETRIVRVSRGGFIRVRGATPV